jgi:hypothetical protein
MDSLHAVAGQLDEAAATLATAARTVTVLGPPDRAFGVDGPGRLGDLGRALRDQWLTAADARAHEAGAAANQLAGIAGMIRVAAASYADTDFAARRRQAEEA